MSLSFLTPTFIMAILIAIAVHECAHAYAALKLGDATAKYQGRLTLNPISHLDPLGTILFVLVGFGWGKPVPVNPMYFKHYKRDNAIVSFAGPLSNFLLAFLAFFVLLIFAQDGTMMAIIGARAQDANLLTAFMSEFLGDLIRVNLILMAFNLLPIAPLDGSKIVHMFVPVQYEEEYMKLMMYGPYILLALIIATNFINISILSGWISLFMMPILDTMGIITALIF